QSSYIYGELGSYFGANNPFTATAWAYISPSVNGPIFGVTSCPPGGCWNMPFLSADGLTVFGWIWGDNELSYTLQKPGWYFLAITYNPAGSGKETLYINGIDVASATGAYSPSGATDYWTTYISGAKPTGVNDYLYGEISNIQAYSTNLTASQIMQLYQEGIGSAPIPNAGLVSWWPLNGNANDYSGNGNNGVGTNIAYTNLNGYVGNPLQYGAIYDPYNYSTVEGFGCSNFALCNSSKLYLPNVTIGNSSVINVDYYVPITIQNAQTTPTPAPFQQVVTVDSQAYAAYEAGNLQNVEFFYPNGQVIPSWLESGNSNTSTSTVYWLELANGIPASSTITIYMGFAPKQVNLLNKYITGEAAQLSPIYGEYDDGASVFNIYGAFGNGFDGWSSHVAYGNFIPKFISAIGAIQLINNTGEGTELFPPNNGRIPKIPMIVEASYQQNMFTSSGSTSDGDNMGLFGNTSSLQTISLCGNSGGNQVGAGASYLQTEPIQSSTCSFGAGVEGNGVANAASGPSYVNGYYYWYMITNSIETKGGYLRSTTAPYNLSYLGSLSFVPSSQNATYSVGTAFSYPDFSFGAGSGGGYMDQYVYWIVGRTYPPNGVMPTATVSSTVFSAPTSSGIPTFVSPPYPKSSYAALGITGATLPNVASFNGQNSNVTISTAIPLSNSQITVCAWINPTVITGTRREIVGNDNTASDSFFLSLNNNGNSEGDFWVHTGSGWFGPVITPGPVPTNSWSFLCGNWTGSDEYIYLNGKEVGGPVTTSNTISLPMGLPMTIGSDAGTQRWDGYMADVSIYNVSLSAQQIEDLYLNGSVPNVMPAAYYPLSGGINGLLNVTPNLISSASPGYLYGISAGVPCSSSSVYDGACGVNYAAP
ncbi:MAG: LamG-like jellyroll fold domain-containing protein, partial [Candidatus Micrarchaeia archaeon]